MFMGEYTHAIDDKGRLTIPAKFREELSYGAVITRGYDRYLVLYTAEAFKRSMQAAEALGWEIVAAEPAEGRIEATATKSGEPCVNTYCIKTLGPTFAGVDAISSADKIPTEKIMPPIKPSKCSFKPP